MSDIQLDVLKVHDTKDIIAFLDSANRLLETMKSIPYEEVTASKMQAIAAVLMSIRAATTMFEQVKIESKCIPRAYV